MKITVTPGDNTVMGLGNYFVRKLHGDQRIIATCSRKCDARSIVLAFDDRELKLLRRFFDTFNKREIAVVNFNLKDLNKTTNDLKRVFRAINDFRAKQANDKGE